MPGRVNAYEANVGWQRVVSTGYWGNRVIWTVGGLDQGSGFAALPEGIAGTEAQTPSCGRPDRVLGEPKGGSKIGQKFVCRFQNRHVARVRPLGIDDDFSVCATAASG